VGPRRHVLSIYKSMHNVTHALTATAYTREKIIYEARSVPGLRHGRGDREGGRVKGRERERERERGREEKREIDGAL